jgi:hypothetical protein
MSLTPREKFLDLIFGKFDLYTGEVAEKAILAAVPMIVEMAQDVDRIDADGVVQFFHDADAIVKALRGA